MRYAFGGVFMFNLLLVFIFIFVAFAAVSLNYAKAFRLKNSLITYVEEQEIISLDLTTDKIDEIDKILQSSSYNKSCDSIGKNAGTIESNEGQIVGYCHRGIIIQQKSSQELEGTNAKLITYEIITYADWNLGALNKILVLGGRSENSETRLSGSWRIKGEAKVVARG